QHIRLRGLHTENEIRQKLRVASCVFRMRNRFLEIVQLATCNFATSSFFSVDKFLLEKRLHVLGKTS
ncbi:MAG: hypothetical protein IKB31_04200, partial [Bacteroidaceae bacterium]|nr:hypothetical protein [Bacteroidaceae bacterium]